MEPTRPIRLCIWCCILPLAATISPAAITINFDDLANNGPNNADLVFVNTQYQNLGVVFNNVAVFDYSKANVPAPGFAHSGNNGIQQCVTSPEFCTTPFQMDFSVGQSHVKVWLGYFGTLAQRETVLLSAYDASGAFLGSATANLNSSFNVQPIRTPLEFNSPVANIRSVKINFLQSNFPTANLALDDVEFDSSGGPPPCPTPVLPTVTLSLPANGDTVQVNTFILQGQITTGDPLATITTTVTGGGGVNTLSSPAISGAFGPTAVQGLLFPGANLVGVTVKDCRGSAAVVNQVTYAPIASGTGVTLDALEVTQSIQDLSNSVPLIADKRTFVRAYLHLTGPTSSLGEVVGTLTACRPANEGTSACGNFLPNLESSNRTAIDATTDLDAKHRDLTATLYFELPPDWTAAGLIHFQISSLAIGVTPLTLPCFGCDDPNPNFPIFPRYHSFLQAPAVTFLLQNVQYRSNGTLLNANLSDIQHLRSWIQRAYPTSRVMAPDNDFGSGFDSLPSCGAVNTALFINKIFSKIFNGLSAIFGGQVTITSLFYGMVTDQGGFMRGCSVDSFSVDLGLTSLSIHVGVGSGPTGDSTVALSGKPDTTWDVDGNYGDWYGGHEIGHLHGRQHPGFMDRCDGTQNRDDKNWPTDAAHANGSIGLFGFDVGDSDLAIPAQVYDPAIWTDIMTYRCNEWISDYTYKGILTRLAPELAPLAAPATGDGLLVTGTINLTTNAVQLAPFLHLSGVEFTPPATSGQFSIELRDRSGAVLFRQLFDPAVSSDAPPEGVEALITQVVPYFSNTASIVILGGTQPLATRGVSANPPRVTVVSPNGGEVFTGSTATWSWTGQDADGDPLTYSLLYSTDAGQTWFPFAIGLTQTTFQVNLASLPGSDRAMFRVVATDGVNTSMDDSNGTFHIPIKAPQVRITSPRDNLRASTTQTVVFTGEALDRQDGYLSGWSLQWTDDHQGMLGSGESIAVRLLSPGLHTITLAARNSAGAQSQSVVHVQVVQAASFDVPGDLNGDGAVDCADLAIVRASFGKSSGQAGFDPRADVNHDGKVDASDLAFVQQRLPAGTACPGVSLTITKKSLATGSVGAPYSDTLLATGGTTPYRWSVTNGRLQAGLQLNATTGQITGVPVSAIASIVTFTVTDSSVPAATASVVIVVTVE